MPAVLNEMADRRSEAADFCNKICQKRTCVGLVNATLRTSNGKLTKL
jgi:hypothetical protein